jgi:LysR family glycine cleavage system transcriptional activator
MLFMRRLPNLARLKVFEAAARLESFTLAADELHLTQSAVSHQIRELEEYFGRKLFERRNRRVEPTSQGKRLLQGLSRVFDALEAACAEVALPGNDQILALHCAPSFAVKVLGPLLPQFMKVHPDITIRLTTGAEPMDLNLAREIDVAISYGSARQVPGVQVQPLGDEEIVPLVAPMLLGKGRDALDALLNLPLIDSPLSQVGWSDWFERNGLTLPQRPRPSFDRAALVIAAAADGMGIALESARLAERELRRGELVVLGAGQFTPVRLPMHFLSIRTPELKTERVRAFSTWLQMHLAEDARG